MTNEASLTLEWAVEPESPLPVIPVIIEPPSVRLEIVETDDERDHHPPH